MAIASLAKEFDHIYLPGRKMPIRLSPGSRVLLLMQRIRDEAHRFAIEYHRKLRNKKTFESGLLQIEGIGPAREKALLEKFKKIENIRKASFQELKEAGLGDKTAKAVRKYFSNEL